MNLFLPIKKSYRLLMTEKLEVTQKSYAKMYDTLQWNLSIKEREWRVKEGLTSAGWDENDEVDLGRPFPQIGSALHTSSVSLAFVSQRTRSVFNWSLCTPPPCETSSKIIWLLPTVRRALSNAAISSICLSVPCPSSVVYFRAVVSIEH